MPKTKVWADIRIGPGGVELVDLEVPEGRRGEAFAWLERALPAIETLDRAVSVPQRGRDGH